MSIKVLFDQIDKNRVFIDGGQGCTGDCVYCYVPDINYDKLPSVKFSSGNQVAKFLKSEHTFASGKYGTAISIGCYADPLHPNHIQKTEEVLDSIMPLGNPIQMASKCFTVNNTIARRLASYQQYPGQLMVLVSITTFQHYKQIEPNVPSPQDRLQASRIFSKAGINTALFIKPMMPDITDHEVNSFAIAIREFRIDRCVVGIFYISNRIVENFKRQAIWSFDFEDSSQGKYHLPNDTNKKLVSLFSNNLTKRFVNHLRELTNILVFKTSMCVIANSLGIPDPMRTWYRYPDLCVGCQDCPGMVKVLPKNIQCRYIE